MDKPICNVRLDFIYFDEDMESLHYVIASSLFVELRIDTPDTFDIHAIHSERGRVEKALRMAGFRFDEFHYSTASHSSSRGTIVYNVSLLRENRDVYL
ncbi:hypothetical protein ABW286_22095 [Erwinia papayae]|uniref:Uncharacterized protein n=1 Tax=Erwinia papayae TaxID=206499 RepID=A0ABV3N7M1_9GAMM|nr:hypothetical protein [Salmonella enterica]EBV3242703.1 hypothetical protein [Salmonella enterica subsp. enterica serovar Oranienburg]EDN5112343.1 hypothetical protein [Salmonella enterica subsp. arizonae]EEP8340228.1 hypothetical protein [Salmonella enterica subsp. enterica serovar Bonn]ECE1560233.1 hypothetical protein [Salmonella enterica]ECF5888631.1 hypothetical protein [Salmonella enterica subsp. indica]